MKKLLDKFLQDPEMKKLYHEAKNNKNEDARQLLNEKFNDFLFEIRFLSYIDKTLSFSFKEFYRKDKTLKDREMCVLNQVDTNTETEFIYSIPDETVDFDKEIICLKESPTLSDYFIDLKVIKAVNKLTDRQKLIIYKLFVEEKTVSQIAKELGIQQKAVYKLKYKAFENLKKWLGGEENGRVS
ncbi:MAG: sigma-70 family RNA polymerase sigma factor [Bacillota bacterium]